MDKDIIHKKLKRLRVKFENALLYNYRSIFLLTFYRTKENFFVQNFARYLFHFRV